MKKTLTLLLAAALLLALCACGGTAGEPAAEEAPSGETAHLAFTGDSHGETAVFRGWIDALQETLGGSLVYLGYSGDICDKSWEPDVFTAFQTVLDETMPGAYGVTTGNQEWKSGAPGATWDQLGEGFVRTGETVRTDDYAVFNFGTAGESMFFAEEDVAALKTYLESAPADIPIFVLSHYSLHDFVKADIAGGGYRCCTNSLEVIELLNQHPNVVYLWGHNHSFADPRYGAIRFPGEEITYDYANPSAKIAINFTYASYGIFCRGSSFGLVAGVSRADDDVHVSLDYYYGGAKTDTCDSATAVFGADGVTKLSLTQGSAISEENILLYSGYPDDPDFKSAY